MNDTNQSPDTALSLQGPSVTAAAPAPAEPPTEKIGGFSRGNGKVARLPKATRDQINHWLQDGLSYSAIIEHRAGVSQ